MRNALAGLITSFEKNSLDITVIERTLHPKPVEQCPQFLSLLHAGSGELGIRRLRAKA